MEIIVGKTSGFCAGVKNAVTKTEKELEKSDEEVYCLGELVHNKQVVEKLEKLGLITIDNIEQANKKTIVRAHGIAKEIYSKAEEKEIELIDLTCPKVLKIHEIVQEYAQNGYFIILIGVEVHPETIGTKSFGGENLYQLRDKEDIKECIEKIEKSKIDKILIISQTTYSLKKFEEIVKELNKKLQKKYQIEIKNTICPATRLRQEETEKISKEVEYMIIVGGINSSNTKKLYDIAKENCEKTISIETVKDLNVEDIQKYNKIGIMAGASTPDESVEEIKKAILTRK